MLFSDITKGIYQHINNKKFYKVIGLGRLEDNSAKLVVVYKQLYDSTLKNHNISLPKGSIWIRDADEFVEKFQLIKTKPELFNAFEELQKLENQKS